MPRPRSLKPSYCIDKVTDRAFVRIDGRKTYLGKPKSQESYDAYDRAIGEWIARGRMPAVLTPPAAAGSHPGDSAGAGAGVDAQPSGRSVANDHRGVLELRR
jgi:hypothetical protein